MKKLIGAALGSVLVAGALLASMPAQAATQHCDTSLFPNMVEVSGDGVTVATNLAPGTYVCLKVGTKVTYVDVAADGTVSNMDIVNSNGKLQAISYYAWGQKRPS